MGQIQQKVFIFITRETYYAAKTKTEHRALKLDDTELTRDDKVTPRNDWRKGKEDELLTGRDDDIRGTVLPVYNKNTDTTSLLKRSIPKLIPLEITNCTNDKKENL